MNKVHKRSGDSVPIQESGLGKRLRGIRKAGSLSVAELASRAGVSAGMISQIERGLSNPSIRILERLRVALAVPLTALLEDDEFPSEPRSDHQTVRREIDRPHFRVGRKGMAKELLSPHGDHELQMMIIALPPHTSSEEVLIGAGEKAGLVLEGDIVLYVEDERNELTAGDSFQFRSTVPHSVHNETGLPARFLWIMNTKRPSVHI